MIELAGSIILGIFAQWLSWRIKIPAILPLILIGLLVGPLATLYTETGVKLIQPIYNQETGQGLFPGEYLFYFVSLAIGVILFEGGLTLKRREIAGVGPVIVKLITLGSFITFIGAGLATHFIMQLDWDISFLIAALIIVTGPTVIGPILQNVPLNRNVATVLKWEGILIDPIGALTAVLVFEFIRSTEGGVEYTSHALIEFAQIILIGLSLGSLAAFGLYQLLKRDQIPHYLLNVTTLAMVLMVFVFSDILAHESGLLSVVVMGMVLGNLDVPRLKEILSFKESLSVLLISILFILLAAHIEMKDLELIFRDWRGLALFGFVALILRPISVFSSTRQSGLRYNEKLFISWVGPRGIVAAGIASLFGLTLTRNGVEGAQYITPLVFMIVMGTVTLNAATARPIARLLRVIQESSEGVLILGANVASRVIARYLQELGRHVVLIDNNKSSVESAQREGLEAFVANIYADQLEERVELVDVGYLIAMTASSEVNNYAMRRYEKVFGERGTFRVITAEELRAGKPEVDVERLLTPNDDFLNLNEVARDFPEMHELTLQTLDQLDQLTDRMLTMSKRIPLFVKDQEGVIHLIPSDLDQLELEGAFEVVYMGQALEENFVEELSAQVPDQQPE